MSGWRKTTAVFKGRSLVCLRNVKVAGVARAEILKRTVRGMRLER